MAWHLLLLEDEASVREAFCTTSAGTRVCGADGRRRARPLDCCVHSEPDILIVDLVMPNLSGLDVLARVPADVARSAGHVLTARRRSAPAVEAMRPGAFDFVAKSIDMDDSLTHPAQGDRILTLQRQVQVHMVRMPPGTRWIA